MEISDFDQSIPGFQECDEEDVETWMACDAEDCGFRMLNVDERERDCDFRARSIRLCIFDVKGAPRTGRPVVENVDKITEIIEVDRHVSSRSITQELKINHKTVLSHLRKVGFKKKLDVWVPQQLTPKCTMDQISICEALGKHNEIDLFLKRMDCHVNFTPFLLNRFPKSVQCFGCRFPKARFNKPKAQKSVGETSDFTGISSGGIHFIPVSDSFFDK
ncbi:histone-lysine N-methyltransferase SETMAR [Trichonephila clavipes]|nr:histone-lysine N-methyltransferase SETMAR [Trichonephila clavipes]